MKLQLVLVLVAFAKQITSNHLIPVGNNWNLVYPCRDNRQISMLIEDKELEKVNFDYILSIEGLPRNAESIITEFESNDQSGTATYPITPGQRSFSAHLKASDGHFPKIKTISIDNVNICWKPLEPVTVNSKSSTTAENTIIGKNNDDTRIRTQVDSVNTQETCGRRIIKHTGLITHGHNVKHGDWPWHAALYRLEGTSLDYICGGTLISQFVVISAAHCVTVNGVPVIPDILNVILGKYYLFGGDEILQDKKVYQIYVHNNFNYTFMENDISLLKLRTQVVFNDYVQPACLWLDEYYEKFPRMSTIYGTVAGWGFDHTHNVSSVLLQARIPKIMDKACLKTNPVFFSRALNVNNFCAGLRNGTSPCNGDSGGGFHVFIPDNPNDPSQGRWYVHGIVSLAVTLPNDAVCDPSHYVLFTDIGKFANWIQEHL